MASQRTALLWALLSLAALLCGMAEAQDGPSIPIKYCAKSNTGFDLDPDKYPIMSDFQSEGRCNGNCTTAKKAFAIIQEKACWCSDYIPAKADLKSTSECNYTCPGYPSDLCGGYGVFAYLQIVQFRPSGTAKAGIGAITEDPLPAETPAPPKSETTSAGEPVVETVTVGGTVRTVTTTPQATSAGNQLQEDSSSSSGLAGGAIAGIVVGIIGGLCVLGAFLFILWKKKRQGDGEKGFVSPMRGGSSSGITGTSKGPMVTADPIGWEAKRRSHLMPVDPRLDPFAKGIYLHNPNRSHDSISSLQDNHDYSRRVTEAPRVLRAINPDPDIP
ncbi:hypothetical protein QBC35DRAFT_222440 [Podospora australis]|uniref:WSC domain-containing protein n=1 Tax=Podospora australis TaxID=1536484 RepID=A0AAN7AP21_9PEZI|nr:hypothetical protein QBC35DRAFT_222440 [Podospora australis]